MHTTTTPAFKPSRPAALNGAPAASTPTRELEGAVGRELLEAPKMTTTDWQSGFGRMLERAAFREYESQVAAHLRRGRKRSTFRYSVPEWQQSAVDAMGRNDEEAAKASAMARPEVTQ
jgi:hypothetical protein